ncbi:MAG TPA: hypothetical protein VJI33_02190 [Candidatus Paceibacterota bacterium]
MSVIILDSKNRPDIEAALSEQLGSILAVDLISKAGESERVAELRADWITSPRLDGGKIKATFPQARRGIHLRQHGQDRQFVLRPLTPIGPEDGVLESLAVGGFQLEVRGNIICSRPIATPPSFAQFVAMERSFGYVFRALLLSINGNMSEKPGQFAFKSKELEVMADFASSHLN